MDCFLFFDVFSLWHIVALHSAPLISETGIESEGLIHTIYADPRFGVLSDSLFEEIRFALETNRLHPFERIVNLVVTITPETEKTSIGTEFDVVAHHARVHPDQFDGEGVDNEFHFDLDRAAYDSSDACSRELVDKRRI